MRSKEILIQLIQELHNYENTNENIEFDDFINFLKEKNDKRDVTEKTNNELILNDNNSNIEREIIVLFSQISKYSKNYLKKVLDKTVLSTSDEFGFLITMYRKDSTTKSELSKLLITEKTSGIETINRLIKKNLVKEFKESHNKKNVYIQITEQGNKEIEKILPEIQDLAKLVVGDLNIFEVKKLHNLLVKLDNFHNKIYLKKK